MGAGGKRREKGLTGGGDLPQDLLTGKEGVTFGSTRLVSGSKTYGKSRCEEKGLLESRPLGIKMFST